MLTRKSFFPFSLAGKARRKYSLIKEDSWKELKILIFKQREDESLGIAWDKFSSLTEICPFLLLPDSMLLQHFWLGLTREASLQLDSLSGGFFLDKTPPEGKELLERLREYAPIPRRTRRTSATEKGIEKENSVLDSLKTFFHSIPAICPKIHVVNNIRIWMRSLRTDFNFHPQP